MHGNSRMLNYLSLIMLIYFICSMVINMLYLLCSSGCVIYHQHADLLKTGMFVLYSKITDEKIENIVAPFCFLENTDHCITKMSSLVS